MLYIKKKKKSLNLLDRQEKHKRLLQVYDQRPPACAYFDCRWCCSSVFHLSLPPYLSHPASGMCLCLLGCYKWRGMR